MTNCLRYFLATTLLTPAFTLVPFGITPSHADDNVISTIVTLQNGGYPLDGADSLTITSDGGIITAGSAIATTPAAPTIGNANTITNQGIISTTGSAVGIYIDGSQYNIISQSGTLSTTGSNGHGIVFVNSHRSDLTQSGATSTTGAGAHGILLTTADINTINITGSLISAQANAILYSGPTHGNRLNLTTGAFLGGAIDLGTGGNFVNIATLPGHSGIWDFGAGSTITSGIQVSGTGAYLVNDNTFYSVDPTGFLARADAVGDTAGMLAGLAASRGIGSSPADFEQPSGFAYTSDDGFDYSDARFWGEFIASTTQYGETSTTLGYNSHQYGVVLGYERDFDLDTSFGLMGGYLYSGSKADSRFTTSQEINSRGGYLGIYGSHALANEIKLFGSLMAGRSANDSSRIFNNNTVTPSFIEEATGTYDNTFIAPSISISMDYVLDKKTTVTPMLSALYAHQWSSGYTETGSSNNLTVGRGQSSVFEGKAELGITRQIDAGEGHQVGQVTARLGAMVRDAPSNETPTLSFAGIGTLSTASNDRGTLFAATAGLDFNFKAKDNMALTASTDVAIGNNNYVSAQGKIGFKVTF